MSKAKNPEAATAAAEEALPVAKVEKEVVADAHNATALEKAVKKAHDVKGVTLFVSTRPENARITIRAAGREVTSFKDETGKGLIFRVPNEIVEMFEKHEFIVSGRFVRAKG